ncbi:glycoside hydrolase family 3 domain protein [Anaeromyxobacter sp. K]|uniref:beta-N-acetylhexosaminidase n=1 Tax=Anaeromyxobacter sp. (strain K) TaxID=447217 RepID=UPI00015F9196|nr:beta-N-acetylhexosaminidase [Anaeromyxobacter sp. K]ACG75602.1 glycoside hydrolase family 3 domain protein [Anaeromyxobacter sp. K]
MPTPTSLDAQVAGLFCVGFDGKTASPEVLELIRRGVHGVVLFARNVESAEQVAALTAELKRAAGRPLLVAVDQEGGRVARLRARHGFTELPPMRAVGEVGDAALAREVGALLGRELRAVGIDQDYAPVVDVDTNPANPVIGDRSLSRDPETVGRLGAAIALGLQSAGVAACAKHFPGHGDTSQDSHTDLPRLPHALERLRAVELAPFRALARAGVASVMTAHVVFEALDRDRPATLSPAVMRLLREEVGFDGCAISDDLEMQAVAGHFPLEESAPGAVAAGVDALLVCHSPAVQHRAIDLVRAAVEAGRIPGDRVAEARGRVGRLLAYAGPPPDPARVRERLRTPEHLALVENVPALEIGRDPTA